MSTINGFAFGINTNRSVYISSSGSNYGLPIYPTLYLKSNIKITSGGGLYSTPFEISLT